MPDEFDDIIGGLEIETPDDIEDYTTWKYLDLLDRKAELETELTGLYEVRFPRTDRGRELHSEWTAVQNAILKREGKR